MSQTKPTPQSYEALQRAYDIFNAELFDGKLDNCLITLQRQPRTYGYISYDRFAGNTNNNVLHELALNPEYFGVMPLIKVLQIMVHEMVHLWQYQFGKPSQKSYHNKEWADKMESVGLMPSQTGMVGGKRTGQQMDDYPLAGGKFLEVAKKIMADDLTIQWYDRASPRHFTPLRSIYHKTNIAEMVGEHSMLSYVPKIDKQDMAYLPLKELLEQVDDKTSTEKKSLQELLEEKGVEQINPLDYGLTAKDLKPTGKKSPSSNSKTKFTCGCGENLWGKPSLEVICAKCDEQFLPVD